jgi:hypothetical protein
MSIEIIGLIISLALLVMFIIMFVVVIRIWNLLQEILRSGGFPTISFSRARRDANEILEGRTGWDYDIDETIEILSRYPDDPEASNLTQHLIDKKNEPDGKRS